MTLGGATGINDRAEITGVGLLANGDLHVFLLIRAMRIIPASTVITVKWKSEQSQRWP